MPGPVAVIFLAVVLVAMALVYAFSSGTLPVTERLGHLWRRSAKYQPAFKERRQQLVTWILSGVAKILPIAADSSSETARLLVRAGYRRPEAATAVRIARVILPIILVGGALFTGFYRMNPVFILFAAAVLGFVLPDLYLTGRALSRQQKLRLALPDALDLLVICVEAGLGLDQALLYVSQELRIAHPALCDEFDLVNAEVHVGKTRTEALRSLSLRTGVEDIKVLVATLVQTERFGTSVADALRIHSDELRTKRRQRAEEMAAKTTVKMVLPLVFCIFPALFVVILGPAVITLIRDFSQLQ
jgi:tight adherence protein C